MLKIYRFRINDENESVYRHRIMELACPEMGDSVDEAIVVPQAHVDVFNARQERLCPPTARAELLPFESPDAVLMDHLHLDAAQLLQGTQVLLIVVIPNAKAPPQQQFIT